MKNGILTLMLMLLFCAPLVCQTNTFTYQGKLNDGSVAANGTYQMQFSLFDLVTGGSQVGTTITLDSVNVTAGVFTVELNFIDADAFDGSPRWLQIAVKRPADPGFTPLSPRQPFTSAPYSIKSLNSDTAEIAEIAVNSTQLGGISASQFVITTDPRMADARPPLAGSPEYIQNRTSPQPSTDFNISGTGSADVLNAATQFNLGGNRILASPGSLNLFAGVNAGASNGSGAANTYFGDGAGQSNVTGSGNSFFGRAAGGSSTGGGNSFFGVTAGQNNTGANNSFFGAGSGHVNAGGFNAFFGYQSGLANTTGNINAFFGSGSGIANTTGFFNSFFGGSSGAANVGGTANSFFGSEAGDSNVNGGANSFFGRKAGDANTDGSFNLFAGSNAGQSNTVGNFNTVLGTAADVTADNLEFASAIGAFARVGSSDTIVLGKTAGTYNGIPRPADTVVIPGPLAANGSGLTNLNAGNITTGTLAIANGGTGSSVKNFVDLTTNQDVGGNKNFAGNVQHFGGLFSYGSTRFVGLLVRPLFGDGVINIRNHSDSTFSQTIFSDETDTYRGYLGYIGSNAGLGARNDTVELGTNGRDLTFRPNNTEVMRFNTSGNIGIGTTTPGSRLHVTGASAGSTILNVENTFTGPNDGFAVQGRSVNGPGVGTGGFFTGGRYGVFARADSGPGTGTTIGVYGNAIGTAGSRYGVWGEANPDTGAVSGTGVIGRAAGPSSNRNIGVEGYASGAPTNWAGYFWGGNTYVENSLAVGTTNPGFKLHVIDGGNSGLRVQTNTAGGTVASFGGSGEFLIDAPGLPGGRLRVTESGNVRIGGNLSLILASGGGISVCMDNFLLGPRLATCSSSLRYKQNIRPYGSGFDLISRLRPVTFNWKSNNMEDLGLVAEEVAEVDPLLATYNEKGEVEGVKYDRIAVVLVNVVKEQEAEIRSLKEQLQELRKAICEANPNAKICEEPK